MTETIETSSPVLSLGEELKKARNALNLTIDDVVQKTNLRKNHIESIENDIFILPNVPPAFVRGYVRNYVRFLRLPEDLVNQANYGEVSIPKEVKKAAPIKVSDNHKSQTRWVKWLTGLILLCAVGMTLAWWWQEHQKDEINRDSLVSTTELSTPVESAENSTNGNIEATKSVEATSVEPVPQTETVTASENAENQPVAQAIATESETPAAENTEKSTETTETAANVLAATVGSQENNAEIEKSEQQAEVVAAGNDELRIEIVGGQSWITVRNVKAKRSLAEKLYNDGDVLTFNTNEQYRLTIGAPANVKLYYKGQQIPLKVDGRVARLKLPQ